MRCSVEIDSLMLQSNQFNWVSPIDEDRNESDSFVFFFFVVVHFEVLRNIDAHKLNKAESLPMLER